MFIFCKKIYKKCFFSIIVLFLVATFVFYYWISDWEEEFQFATLDIPEYSDHYARNRESMINYEKRFDNAYFENKNITSPIVIWWTPFTLDIGSYKQCGAKKQKCFFTNVRKFRENKQQEKKAFLYYGSDFYLHDLPLPRRKGEEWGLMHEESPKNNFLFSFEPIMQLFNHTATFKQESDLPLLTQYLTSIEDIESKMFLKSVEHKNKMIREGKIAPVAYVQSDCYTPSNRDLYVQTLMQHIKVDSYGKCLHNKDLPQNISVAVQSMHDESFYEILSNYKFILSIENAICDDYVTEKLWRTYYVGSVPILLANHERIDEYLPTPNSAINVKDFKNAQDLAKFLHHLNDNDAEYEKYLSYKTKGGVTSKKLKQMMAERTWGINNDRVKGNFIDAFECLVCERLHENQEHQARKEHYGCPHPITFDTEGRIIRIEDTEKAPESDFELRNNQFQGWTFSYMQAYASQRIFFEKHLAKGDYNITANGLRDDAYKYYQNHFVRNRSSRVDLK